MGTVVQKEPRDTDTDKDTDKDTDTDTDTDTGDSDLSAVKDESLIEEILAFLRGGADGAILPILGLFIGNWTLAAAASIADPWAMATFIRATKKRSNAFLPLAIKKAAVRYLLLLVLRR